MKVLYVTNNDGKLGGAKALIEIITEMKKRDVQPIVLTPVHNEINEYCNKNEIKNYAIKYKCYMYVKSKNIFKNMIKFIPRYLTYKYLNKKAIAKIENMIDIKSLDYIHTNTSIVDIGAIIAKRNNIKHIWHIREFGNKDFNFKSYRKNYIDFINNNSNAILAISKAVKDEWIKKGIDKNKINLVYDGIDISDIKIKKKINEKDNIDIVFSGSITPNKGQEHLIKALGYIEKDILKKIHIDFIGNIGSKYYKELIKLIEKMKVEKNISFLGYRNNLRENLSSYEIGVICSKSEGFGRVTAEYMAAELCVIASDTGANTELIENEKNGLIYNYNNDKELAEKIKKIYNNKKLIDIYGKNARDTIIEKFTKEINADNIKKIYLRGKRG